MISPSPIVSYLWEKQPENQGSPHFWWKQNSQWVSLSFAEYWQRIFSLSNNLQKFGLKNDSVVLVILNNSIEWDLLEKACFHLGMAIVAIEPHAHPSLIDQVIKETRPQLLICEKEVSTKLTKSMSKSESEFNLNSDSFVTRRDHTWEKLFSDDSDIIDPSIRNPNILDANSTDLNTSLTANNFSEKMAYHVFTSGTTGKAKVISYKQSQVLGTIQELLSHEGGWPQKQIILCWLPLANLFQRMTNLCAQAKQGEIYLWDSPKNIINALKEVRPHVFIGVPRFYEKLKTKIESTFSSFWFLHSSIKNRLVRIYLKRLFSAQGHLLISGSAPLQESTLHFFKSHGLTIMEAYGMTECILPISINTLSSFKHTTVGKPLIKDIQLNDDGRILIKSPYIGSWKFDSQFSINTDGYFETEDYGMIDKDGFLKLIGRSSNIIKLSTGRKIQRESIESQIKLPRWVSRILIYGDKSNALFALVEPESSLEFENSHVLEIQKTLEQANLQLNSYEKIRGAILKSRPLTLEKQEITSNLKVRYSEVEKNNKDSFDMIRTRISENTKAWTLSHQQKEEGQILFSIDG